MFGLDTTNTIIGGQMFVSLASISCSLTLRVVLVCLSAVVSYKRCAFALDTTNTNNINSQMFVSLASVPCVLTLRFGSGLSVCRCIKQAFCICSRY